MKFSKRVLLRLKNKNKKLKPDKYKRLRRECLRGSVKGTIERLDYQYTAQMRIFMLKSLMIQHQIH